MTRALIIRGGWTGHEPVETTDLVAAELRNRGMECDIFDNMDCLTTPEELIEKYDVVIPAWTMGAIPDGANSVLCKVIKAGVGLAGWHGGMGDAFRSDTDYQMMVGGQFVAHPPMLEYEVNIISDDPIVSGIGNFKIFSELYYMHVDPSNEVLATTICTPEVLPVLSQNVCMPTIWKRKYGAGKVFYSALGHNSADFKNYPQILEIAVCGILWAAR